MAIIRVEKTKDYTTMSNYHFKEKDMSLKAKGLLSLILSLPEEWDYTLAGLAMLCKDGKDSVRTALSELEEFRYVETARVRDEKGRLRGTEYVVYERPVANLPSKEATAVKESDLEESASEEPILEEPASEEPGLEEPGLEKPMLENPTLEKPILEKPTLEKPILEKPTLEKPTLEKPTLENPTQLNTNISNTNKLNIYISNHGKEDTKSDKISDSSRAYYPEDARLNEAFKAFVYMRKRINKPLTNKAVGLTKESLAKMAADENGKMDIEKAICILNQSVMNSWSGLYALKQPVQDRSRGQTSHDLSEEEWQNLEKQVLAN